MRKFYFTVAVFVIGLFSMSARAQDFSNKGKDFWVGYGLHCRMYQGGNGGTQDMVLYFATDQVTTVTVSIPGNGYTQTYANIPANTIFETQPIPKTGSQDARLLNEGVSSLGIHIQSDKPIVAYAHIYNGNVSGATLLFPTPTLGKEYYSMNFTQYSNETHSNCFFYAIATDTGTTTIQVVPSATTQTMTAGQTYTFNLTQGQIFNALGTETTSGGNTSGTDLTGSTIKSISNGTSGCKRIAVFSGAGKLNIHCPIGPSNNSADNYMVQAFPKAAWGKYFLTTPTQQMPYNFFRIGVSDPTTVVKLNGSVLSGLTNNFYYQVGQLNTPNVIEADKPIMVAQYITSANQCGNNAIGANGDPEVIYLSPVEQNINKVIINSTAHFAINANWHYINVIIPNGGTALSSFKIDGNPISPATFVTHPQNPAYSYLIYNFPNSPAPSAGAHTIESDSGFNAIAYGYGNAESYGYNAGSNIKDQYQFIQISNPYATVNYPASCVNRPFYFSIVFPYQPTQIQWIFGAALNAMGINDTTLCCNPIPDSSWQVSGRWVYRYKLPTPYTITAVGTYPIQVIAQNPTPDGCSGIQEIDYNLEVNPLPVANFTFTDNGCFNSPVQFTGSPSNTNNHPIINNSWNFGDASTASVQNPSHTYASPGNYTVKYSVITDVGCLSDTVAQIVSLNQLPTAKFGISFPQCVNKTITFTDSSTAAAGSTLKKWYWDFGDGSPLIIDTVSTTHTHVYTTVGTYTATLKVETATGCQSTVFSKIINVHAVPLADFNFSNSCLPAGTTQFTSTATISDGTQALFIYSWNFGDGSPAATIANPVHNYSALGPYNVMLTVTSNNGCADDTLKVMNTVYAQPQAAFTAPAEVCDGTAASFTDQSTAANSTITGWHWNFGDGTISTQQNPSHTYPAPGTYTVTLVDTSAIGCVSTVATKTIVVNPLPTANFSVIAPTCATRIISFTDASSANAGSLNQWNWNFGDGQTSTLQNPQHVYATAGTYTATLQVQSTKGCVSPVTSKNVTVNVLPQAGFIAPQICLTDPFAPFIDTSKVSPGSIVAWNWNFGDPNANAANPNTSVLQNPFHRYSVVGSYTATLIVTTNNGCRDTIAETFTVNGSIPVANFTVQNANTLCSNQDVTIKDISTVDFGSIVKMDIYWDVANNPTVKTTFNNPLPNQNYSHSYGEFGTPFTKTYTIKMVVYSGINCLNTITKNITVLATPTVQFDALQNVCSNIPAFQITQAFITNALPGGGVFSGPGTSSAGIFDPAAAGAGVYTLRYTYTGANTCSNYKEQGIEVYPTPIANAGPDKTVLAGGFVTLTPAVNAGYPITYLWTPSTGLDNPNISSPKASPPDDITYTLRITSDKGCTTTDDVFVKVLKMPIIPNIFSPNGDGVHDKWEIAYLASYPGCTIDIYNRYGQLIYHSVGYDKPWDGTVNGKPVPVGTYYYIVDPKNGRQKVSGYVDVIR